MCNNGTLTAVDDDLPTGYKRVQGFSVNDDCYWRLTDFKLNGSDTLRLAFSVTAACNVIGAYSGNASGNNLSLYVAISGTGKYLRYKDGAYNSVIDTNTRYDVVITPTGSVGMKTDSTWDELSFTTTTDFCIGTTSTNTSSAKLKGSLFGNITVDGRLDLVPCERISDGVLGYYDLVGEAFYAPTSGTPTSLGYDYDHVHVEVVGTPEVLTVRPGEHLVLSASDFTQVDERKVKTVEFISVQPGTDYVYAFNMVDTVSGVKYETDFETYDADGNRLRSIGFGNTNGCRSGQFTADSNEVKVKINIHCKSSSDTMTLADIVSFAFDAQSTSYDPAGKNLFNRLNCVYGKYLNSSGSPTSNSMPSCYSHKIPLDSNKTYTFSGVSSNVGNNNKRVCFYKADDSFISAQATAVTNADVPYSVTFTPPANTTYCRLSLNTADTEVMLEEGSTQTAYEPYIDESWQTASVPMLLSVGNYADEAEIISGGVTRRAVARRLTSDETGLALSKSGNTYRYRCRLDDAAYKSGRGTDILCSHASVAASGSPVNSVFLNGSSNVEYMFFIPEQTIQTVDDFKAWLDANLVIVIYPLATETTEQITGQNLVTNEGTNTVDVTAEVSPVELKVNFSQTKE